MGRTTPSPGVQVCLRNLMELLIMVRIARAYVTTKTVFFLIASVCLIAFPLPARSAQDAKGAARDLVAYSVQGYAVDGPFQVVSVTNQQVVLASAPENLVVNKDNTTASVKTFPYGGSVKNGDQVYVLRKGTEVIFFALPAAQSTDHPDY